jgi:hypothetical protein
MLEWMLFGIWLLSSIVVCLLLLWVRKRDAEEERAAKNWRRSNYFGDRR